MGGRGGGGRGGGRGRGGGGGGGRGGRGGGRGGRGVNVDAPQQQQQQQPKQQQQQPKKQQQQQQPQQAGEEQEAGMGWAPRNRRAQQQQQAAAAAADSNQPSQQQPKQQQEAEHHSNNQRRRHKKGQNHQQQQQQHATADSSQPSGQQQRPRQQQDQENGQQAQQQGRRGDRRRRRSKRGNAGNAAGDDGATAAAKVEPTAITSKNVALPPKKLQEQSTEDKPSTKKTVREPEGAATSAGATEAVDGEKKPHKNRNRKKRRGKVLDKKAGKEDSGEGKGGAKSKGERTNDRQARGKQHVDPFADPVGAHVHDHRLPPENIHGHNLLEENDDDDDGLPAALHSGASSSVGDDDDDRADGTDEDFSDNANERQKEYRPGGYHPVYVGEIYNNRYRVVHKLGWGYFSTVWMVWDYDCKRFQAMKVQKSASHYRDAARDEIKLLTQIMGADPAQEHCCARMVDHFEHAGPHGIHVVMVFDILGENLLKLMERYEYKGIPIPIVKSIAKQTLIGLRHLHSIDIIHTDLKPENVLLAHPKHSLANIMKRYKPPQRDEQLSLLARDRTMMTKSQKRRYDAKMRRLKKQQQEQQQEGDATAAADSKKDASEDDGSNGSDAENNGAVKAARQGTHVNPSAGCGRSASGGVANKDGLALEIQAGVRAAEEAVNGEDSETDAEWEVQRFQQVCLADFGNSCWTYKQFADEVQTRQYRCPEVIIGDPYDCAIDLWSAACMFFELLTGEFLFDPKDSSEYPRDEDHLALIMELLGPLPPHMAMGRGKFRDKYFNSRGQLRHIRELRYWGLRDVLHKKYRFTRAKSAQIAEFLLPMLALDPRERATAAEMLEQFDDFFVPLEDDFAPNCFSTGESDDEDDEGAMPRPFTYNDDAVGAAEEDEDDDIGAWLANHPLLQEDQLAALGLELSDVVTVLNGSTLDDPQKQQLVDVIIERLQEDAEGAQDDGVDADVGDDSDGDDGDASDDEDDEEEEDAEETH